MKSIRIELTKKQLESLKPILDKQIENAENYVPGFAIGNLLFKDKHGNNNLFEVKKATIEIGILPNAEAIKYKKEITGLWQEFGDEENG